VHGNARDKIVLCFENQEVIIYKKLEIYDMMKNVYKEMFTKDVVWEIFFSDKVVVVPLSSIDSDKKTV